MEHNYKNKYGTDLSVVKSTLNSNQLLNKIMENYDRKGYLSAYCHAVEKWNYDNREGPPWDVNGYSCEDIYVRVYPTVKELPSFWLSNIKSWLKESWKDSYDSETKNLNLKGFLRNLKSYFKIHMTPYDDFWPFVIDSFKSSKSDIVDKIVCEKLGGWEKYYELWGTAKGKKQIQDLASKVDLELNDREAFIEVLNKENYRINSYLWVKKSDPTVFIVDEKIRPFDLPSGWSEKYIIETLLVAWFYWLKDKRIKVKTIKV